MIQVLESHVQDGLLHGLSIQKCDAFGLTPHSISVVNIGYDESNSNLVWRNRRSPSAASCAMTRGTMGDAVALFMTTDNRKKP